MLCPPSGRVRSQQRKCANRQSVEPMDRLPSWCQDSSFPVTPSTIQHFLGVEALAEVALQHQRHVTGGKSGRERLGGQFFSSSSLRRWQNGTSSLR